MSKRSMIYFYNDFLERVWYLLMLLTLVQPFQGPYLKYLGLWSLNASRKNTIETLIMNMKFLPDVVSRKVH